jgi:hypothetical protein
MDEISPSGAARLHHLGRDRHAFREFERLAV